MGLSERRACQIISADRKTIRYRSSRPPEVDLRAKLRDLANERRRFGYRRLFILLRRDGEPSGVNRIYRLYREEGLSVRKRKARPRAVRMGFSQVRDHISLTSANLSTQGRAVTITMDLFCPEICPGYVSGAD
ncbi:Integrase catalytic region [Rhizobium grahamii CCGE 502]|uniref:Integrase catalytic region n=1 Tax=Rhizobium grahamii CCGE 502 TaxID=990285 RepID=S3HUP6_9HYPH|nr:Integrase catalytic region [Rhizobium grahamii CCGE 502]